jgi:hypothetical protein
VAAETLTLLALQGFLLEKQKQGYWQCKQSENEEVEQKVIH